MENKRYEGLDSCFYEDEKPSLIERISGARKVIAGIAITAALVGSVPIGLEISCHRNDPTMFVCPITQLETKLFGYETGLRHQAKDLEGYSRELSVIDDGINHEVSATDVEYVEGETRYYAPNGGILTQDEAGKMIVEQIVPATVTTLIGEDGKEQTIYTVPAGYVLEGSVGVKRVAPAKVEVPTSVEFDYNFLEDGEIVSSYDQSWTYENGEFTLNREAKGKSR